eukprot:360326-Chlamydomonas_euryale.AAC.1
MEPSLRTSDAAAAHGWLWCRRLEIVWVGTALPMQRLRSVRPKRPSENRGPIPARMDKEKWRAERDVRNLGSRAAPRENAPRGDARVPRAIRMELAPASLARHSEGRRG